MVPGSFKDALTHFGRNVAGPRGLLCALARSLRLTIAFGCAGYYARPRRKNLVRTRFLFRLTALAFPLEPSLTLESLALDFTTRSDIITPGFPDLPDASTRHAKATS